MNQEKVHAPVPVPPVGAAENQNHKHRLSLIATMVLLPLLTFVGTLMLPWPQPVGTYAGVGVLMLWPHVVLEGVVVSAIATVTAVIVAARAQLGLLGF